MSEIQITNKIVILADKITAAQEHIHNNPHIYIDADIFVDWIGIEKNPDGGPPSAIFNVRYPGGVGMCSVILPEIKL